VTSAEARLVPVLLHNKSLKQYADESAISVHTARAQMQSLPSNTGTNRQAAVVRLFTNVFSTLNFA
jgi:hypothetical protein